MICRSRRFFVRLKSLFLTIFLLLSVMYRDVSYASTPTENDLGCMVGSVRISKANLPYVDDNIFLKLPYNGQYQMIDIIKERYEDKGIVHYKIGENGKWVEGIPSLKDVGNYDLYYYIEGDRNHNNLRSKVNPFKMNVDIFVPKDDWGTKVDNDGYTNYVTSDGKTSAEIDEYGIIWLKEESDGTYAWYGVDNRSKTFALGSRFWVRWLSAERDKEEYQKYLEQLDDESKTKAEEGKLWIFLTGVTNPDGIDYTNLDISIPYYIQLGDDWDEEDVRAYYVSEEKDEKLTPEIGSVDYFNSSSDKIAFPENSDYAKLYLKHFSPYTIMDTKDDFEKLDIDNIKLRYTGKYQFIDKIENLYKKGTIYYKVGESGTWTEGTPSFKDVGNYNLYYYVKGNDEYNDLGSTDNPLHIKVTVEPKNDFEKLNVNDIKLKYTGTNQNIDKFDSLYEEGTVYYKVGESGTWTEGTPSFKDVGNYDLYYYVKGNDEYNDLGSTDNPLHIKVTVEPKNDFEKLNANDIKLKYTGTNQNIDKFDSLYGEGTIYYKVGESGTWTEGMPSFKDVGNYDLYYYVKGNNGYNDLGSTDNPLHIKVVLEDWGTKVDNSGHTNYVTSDGKTSAEIDKYGVVWLKEESDGTSAWYGLDNTSGTFALGSRFWVKWLSAERDKEEYQKYFEQLDDEHKKRAEINKLWIFVTGVTSPDGVDYTNLDVPIPYYIQLGDDWDENEINAVFISQNVDEIIDLEFGDVSFFDSKFENINFPETNGRYARLLLKHFSPYAIYDELFDTIYEGLDNNKINSEKVQGNNKVTNYDKSYSNKNTGDDTYIIRYMITIFAISLMILIILYLQMINKKIKIGRIWFLLRRLFPNYKVHSLTNCDYNRTSNSDSKKIQIVSINSLIVVERIAIRMLVMSLSIVNNILKTTRL